jgi:multiple sugar transport system ATP-binding protein
MPRALSGGQRQRVALARSVVRQPRVFLMDEPLSNLDAKLRLVARSQIKHLVQELAVTTLYVTHDQVEAMTLAHRVAVMHEGVIRQLDTPERIYDRPADTFVAGFIGSPAMNLVPVAAEGSQVQAEGGVPLRLRAPRDGELTLGVRAEDIALAGLDDADLQAEVYTCELLGDSTLVTVQVGRQLVSVKADKAVRVAAGARVGLKLPPERAHWFDRDSGRHL